MIPVNDKVTVTKSAGLDDWGDTIPGVITVIKARVNNSTVLTTDSNGQDVVGKGTIYFNNFVDIEYADTIEFTEANGSVVLEHPLNINFKKDLGGAILITKVVV